MQMFVLAAGLGSRLYPLTKHTPKSLLDLGNGTNLLESQLEAAALAGTITDVHVVTGYRAGQVEEWVRNYSTKLNVATVFNPFFDASNSLVSLWCVHHLMAADDFIVVNGDTLFRYQGLLRDLIAAPGDGVLLTSSRKAEYDEDDMKIVVNDEGRLLKVGKDVPPQSAQAESAGIALVRGAKYRALYAAKVVALMKNSVNHQRFWHDVFNGLADDGVYPRLFMTGADTWAEFDFHPDISTIRSELAQKMAQELKR